MTPRDMVLTKRAAPPADVSVDDAARRGDPDALEAIAVRELPKVERLLIRLLGPRADLEDLVQTVFLEACRALPGFRGESTLSTFIGGITVRVARRAMRPQAWWRRRGAMPEDVLDPRGGPDDSSHQAEQLRRARQALEKISAKKRIAFLLWALDGMSFEEVAKITGASLSATRSRIFHAQRELRKRAAHDPYLAELLEDGER